MSDELQRLISQFARQPSPQLSGAGPSAANPPARALASPGSVAGPAHVTGPGALGGQPGTDPLDILSTVLTAAPGSLGNIGRILQNYQGKQKAYNAANGNYQKLIQQGMQPAEAAIRARDSNLMAKYYTGRRDRQDELDDQENTRANTLDDRDEARKLTLEDRTEGRDHARAGVVEGRHHARDVLTEGRTYAEGQTQGTRQYETEKADRAAVRADEALTQPQKHYSQYVKQTQANGEKPMDFNPWLKQMKEASAMKMPKGQTEADKAFGKDNAKWNYGGGRGDVRNQMSTLEGSIKALRKTGTKLTGMGFGAVDAMAPEWLTSTLYGESKDHMQRIQTVAQRSLKAILGAQFARVEGEMLLNRAFNPALHPSINAERAERILYVLREMQEAKDAASDYFAETGGTMSGYKANIADGEARLEALEEKWAAEDAKRNLPDDPRQAGPRLPANSRIRKWSPGGGVR